MTVLLNQAEEKLFRSRERLVSAHDVQAIVDDCFDGRCAVSGAVDNLVLRRFRRDQPASPANIVVLGEKVARRFDKGEDVFVEEKREEIEKRLREFNKK